MPLEQLADYTAGLRVLYVEDDPISALLLQKMLEPHFSDIHAAQNGVEGVEKFHQLQPDIVITDLMMPILDGIGMIRTIRDSNSQVPVLLITASLEHIHLVEAINLGVSKFLAKPLSRAALDGALLSVCREMAMQRVLKEAREQEVELLRLRDRHHARHEELARRKEQHIVQDRLQGKFVSDPVNGSWLADLLHHPKDIMSGDSYAIRRMPNNTLQVFLADAMGHGLSASVTSMLATAFYNHINDGCACNKAGFGHMALRTMLYAARTLLEDEVFSACILLIDPGQQRARMVSCGMPPLQIIRNGVVERFRGGNPPVSAFMDDVVIQEFSLAGVSDILLATDGLGEAATEDGGMYSEYLADDLLTTTTARELYQAFQARKCAEHDDITMIRLISTAKTATTARTTLTVPGTTTGITSLQQQVGSYFDEAGVYGTERERFMLAFTEALQNSFEHGCLGLGARKQQLIFDDTYDEQVAILETAHHRTITAVITCAALPASARIWLELIDQGSGFSPQELIADIDAPCGRGLQLIKRHVDLVRHNEQGTSILLLQTISGDSQ